MALHIFLMRSTEEEAHAQKVAHAQWRVNFLRSLFESHRLMACWKNPEWEEKLSSHAQRLEEAEAELKRLETVEQ
jgi:hypothetical protein